MNKAKKARAGAPLFNHVTRMTKAPFSQRHAVGKPWIHEDFPNTARTALLHLLHDLVERKYVNGWIAIDKEVRRIARDDPSPHIDDNETAIRSAQSNVTETLGGLKWASAFDFLERLHSHLATDVSEWHSYDNGPVVVMEREEVQLYIAEEIERLLLEERLGFTFADGEVRARGRRHTRTQVSKVEPTFADSRLSEARQHFAKAVRYFEKKEDQDYENVIKEAVCAVEAAAKRLFPDAKGKTLGDVVKDLVSGTARRIPKQIGDTITGLYGYRNGGDGIAHGATGGGRATRALAEYALAVAASQIILLHTIESEEERDIPF